MIKFLECPDLHYDPKHDDIMANIFQKIIMAATTEKVDFILLPGDLFERPLIATDSGGYNKIRKLIRSLLKICPVVAIEGTPSHDGAGCYNPLEDLGLILLKPNKLYGYISERGHSINQSFVVEIKDDNDLDPDCILFGIPELNKNHIMSQLDISAEEANKKTVDLFNKYITEFVAPMRMKYESIPAVCMFHGNVSDSRQENSSDQIIKHSDIIIHTETLEIANIDRWSLGHIHKPWESERIFAGYAGSWGSSWKETGFVPGMNLIILNNTKKVEEMRHVPIGGLITGKRIHYGTPKREKIKSIKEIKDPNIAYWLETNDPNEELPENIHPWSKKTIIIEKKETQRVSKEDAAKIQSLSDLFKILDPDVSKSVIKKVDSIDTASDKLIKNKVDAKLLSVKIKGCDFFGGKTITLKLDELNQELNAIHGDNGAGKSSLLSFCSLYPVVIGKDTDSGRTSAIKDFFSGQESSIEKYADVNGEEHRHLITIKGAHTKTPKVECYLFVDGKSILDKGTFDEMFSKCEELYGNFNDYLLTTFYVQPLQGKTQSSLMSAGMTDIRNLVQNISGIDRETEKRIALDNIKILGEKIEEKKNWLQGAGEFTIDIEKLKKEIQTLLMDKNNIGTQIFQIEQEYKSAKKELDELKNKKTDNDIQKSLFQSDQNRIIELKNNIGLYENQIIDLSKLIKNLDNNKIALQSIIDTEFILSNIRDYDNELKEVQNSIREQNILADNMYSKEMTRYNLDKNHADLKIKESESEIKLLNKPCVNCGYIDPDSAEKIKTLKFIIEENQAFLDNIKIPQAPSTKDIPNRLNRERPEEPESISVNDKSKIETEIKEAEAAESKIENLKERIKERESEIQKLESKQYNIIEGVEQKLDKKQDEHDKLNHELNSLKSNIAVMDEQISNKDNAIKREEETRTKIKETEKIVSEYETDLEDWKYISVMLRADKVPALELDLVKDMIDAEANQIIKPFLVERYQFETETQKAGKGGIVDKFDIKIHDLETGSIKSFTKYNPGHKAFFNDAYVKALVKIRNEKTNRNYSPVIMDEADGPIQPERISQFYEMQQNYWKNTKVLVVSHTPVSHEFIENRIDIEQLKE